MGNRVGLSRYERLFVETYLDCYDVAEAARRSGALAKGETAAARRRHFNYVGRKMARRSLVVQEIERRLTGSLLAVGVEKGKVLRQICRIAFFDPRNLSDEDGSPLAVHELDDDTAAGVGGHSVEAIYEGRGDERRFVGNTHSYQYDKRTSLAALKLLGDHLRLWGEEDAAKKTDRLEEIVNALRDPEPVAPASDGPKLLEGKGGIKKDSKDDD